MNDSFAIAAGRAALKDRWSRTARRWTPRAATPKSAPIKVRSPWSSSPRHASPRSASSWSMRVGAADGGPAYRTMASSSRDDVRPTSRRGRDDGPSRNSRVGGRGAWDEAEPHDELDRRSRLRPPRLALIAHDEKKQTLADWAATHRDALAGCDLFCTGSTGRVLMDRCPELRIWRVKSGPLGGDQQIGGMIAEGRIDGLIFFVDPMTPLPHDVDVKALTRLAVVYDVPMACSRRAADYVLAGVLSNHADSVEPEDDGAGWEQDDWRDRWRDYWGDQRDDDRWDETAERPGWGRAVEPTARDRDRDWDDVEADALEEARRAYDAARGRAESLLNGVDRPARANGRMAPPPGGLQDEADWDALVGRRRADLREQLWSHGEMDRAPWAGAPRRNGAVDRWVDDGHRYSAPATSRRAPDRRPPSRRRVLLLVGDYVESADALGPYQSLSALGHRVDAVCPGRRRGESVRTAVHDLVGDRFYGERPGHDFVLTYDFDEALPHRYDALVLPGGRAPEYLRLDPRVIALVRDFASAETPIAAVRQGAQLLAAADVIRGRRIAADATSAREVTRAGAHFTDIAPDDALVDGGFVTAPGWTASARWMRAVARVLA